MDQGYDFAKGAERLEKVPVSLIRAIMNRAAELEAEGKPVIRFSAGEPNFNTPSDIKEAAIRAITNNYTHYASNKGYDPLRIQISQYMAEFSGVHYDPLKEILVTSSAAEALNNAMLAFVDPGDEVIVPTPAFVTYEALTALCGATMVELPLRGEEGFQLHPEELEKKITSKTKMLILNNPCNPTGAVLPYETLKAICALAKKYNFMILADEIYSRLVYGDSRFYSVASFEGMKDRTILVSGFSKTFAMTGWRLGYICAAEKYLPLLVRTHQYSTTSAPTFIQVGVAETMDSALTRQQVQAMIAEFAWRRDLVVRELDGIPGLSYSKPEGAFYILINVSCLHMKGTEFSRKLLEEKYVATVPAIGLGDHSDTYVRLSYAASREDLREGFRRIKEMAKEIQLADQK